MRQRFRIHPMARVFDCQRDVRTWTKPGITLGARFVEMDISGLNRQFTAVGHGIASVDHQVHQNLFHLAGIGAHPAQLGVELHHQANIFANQRRQELGHLSHQIVEVQYFRLQHLLAAQCQQLPRQCRSALRRTQNAF